MKNEKNTLKLTKEQKENTIELLKEYFWENFDLEVSDLQSNLFVDFLNEQIGKYYYNLGINDSVSTMNDKVLDLYLLMKEEKM